MHNRPLGTSGIQISTIGLGTNYVGGHNLYADIDEDEGVRLVQRAMDLGVTFIDTADVYGLGRSEELVGKAIAGRRDEVVLATKGAALFGDGRSGVDTSPAYLREALHASLKRLNVEHVDLYYIHRHDGKTPPEESYGALMDFKREGLIRAGGVSNFDLPTLKAASQAGPIDALQSRFNVLQTEVMAEILPWCVENSVSFIPWGPLAYGLLGGRYGRDFKLGEGDWRVRSGAFDDDVYPRNMDIVDGLKALAATCESTPAHLAVQWLLAQPGVGSVIAGAKTSAQVEDNVNADAAALSESDLHKINELLSA
jgi:myo-inositol catabolism protein IolS